MRLFLPLFTTSMFPLFTGATSDSSRVLQQGFFTEHSELMKEVKSYCMNQDSYDTTKYGSIERWDVSRVTAMNNLFSISYNGQVKECNPDIGKWDVSASTTFRYMFESSTFNQDISLWDVSSSKNFDYMFSQNYDFNQDISGWDVSSATSFSSTFAQAPSFNQDIGDWDVSNGSVFVGMFYKATSFNGNIGSWEMSNAFNLNSMFNSAESFNQDIGRWDVVNVFYFLSMFEGAKSFNQDISSWDLSSGYYFSKTLKDASAFRQNLDPWLQWYDADQWEEWCTGAICDYKQNPKCEGLEEKKCRKKKKCKYSSVDKTWGDCEPKREMFEHDCAQYTSSAPCMSYGNAGLCTWNNDICSHECAVISKKIDCKSEKFLFTPLKMCKMLKGDNPCYGCHAKSECTK